MDCQQFAAECRSVESILQMLRGGSWDGEAVAGLQAHSSLLANFARSLGRANHPDTPGVLESVHLDLAYERSITLLGGLSSFGVLRFVFESCRGQQYKDGDNFWSAAEEFRPGALPRDKAVSQRKIIDGLHLLGVVTVQPLSLSEITNIVCPDQLGASLALVDVKKYAPSDVGSKTVSEVESQHDIPDHERAELSLLASIVVHKPKLIQPHETLIFSGVVAYQKDTGFFPYLVRDGKKIFIGFVPCSASWDRYRYCVVRASLAR